MKLIQKFKLNDEQEQVREYEISKLISRSSITKKLQAKGVPYENAMEFKRTGKTCYTEKAYTAFDKGKRIVASDVTHSFELVNE